MRNTISHGPHSKFEEARVVLKGGTELIFHHGIGGLLDTQSRLPVPRQSMWLRPYAGQTFHDDRHRHRIQSHCIGTQRP
jgi:hypothetical protein